MKTSQNILNFLEIHGPSTVAEISIALERTKADIREQIDQLLAQNRVERLTADRLDTPGRPAARFMLQQKTPEPLIKGLIAGLMEFIKIKEFDQKKENEITNLLITKLMTNFHPHGYSSVSRMNQAVAYLESIGIKTKWIATHSGPKISLLHENISNILNNPSISNAVVKQLISQCKEKAVGN